MPKPKYNNARGPSTLEAIPPFDFHGVTMRVFPLRANIRQLTTFIDKYLNIAPREHAIFKPYVPYVYLMMLHYQKMESQVASAGWNAQHEIAFAVPLEWCREKGGRLVFQDWASVCPFILVDDGMSQITGREVYGWPKLYGWLSARVSPWANHPRSPQHLLTFSSSVFAKAYAGERAEERVLLEVLHEPPPTVAAAPLDTHTLNPMGTAARVVSSAVSMAGKMYEVLLGPQIRGYPRTTSMEDSQERFARGFQDLLENGGRPAFTNINLKQFRDAQHQELACFQAITASSMRVTRFARGGLLGDLKIFQGDHSGGYKVRLHHYDSFPVVETLGLEVESLERTSDETGTRVYTLKPTYPLWCEVDFNYGTGKVLSWRGIDGKWNGPEEKTEEQTSSSSAQRRRDEQRHGHEHHHEHRHEQALSAVAPHVKTAPENPTRFNTSLGASAMSTSGPFVFPGCSTRVLPLKADIERLRVFIDEHLNDGHDRERWHCEPWANEDCAYVYMVINSFGDMASVSDNVGHWANRRVTFTIPLKWYDNGQLRLGYVAPYVFSDSQVATSTSRELYGYPSARAIIEASEDGWLTPDGPDTRERTLVSVTTESLVALGAGLETQKNRCLEVTTGNVLRSHDRRWNAVSEKWGKVLLDDRKAKLRLKYGEDRDVEGIHRDRGRKEFEDMKTLALEILGRGTPTNSLSLKQFRDSENPLDACYQSIVLTRHAMDHLWHLEEIEDVLHVRIFDVKSLPIVDVLGLEVKNVALGSGEVGGLVYELEAIRPFWFRCDQSTDVGYNLCTRTEAGPWTYNEPPPSYFGKPPRIGVGSELVQQIEEELQEHSAELQRRFKGGHAKRHALNEHYENWWADLDGDPDQLVSPEDAREAVEALGPQTVIESVLSDEWGNGDRPRWYRHLVLGEHVKQKPDDFPIHREGVGPQADRVLRRLPEDASWRSGRREDEEGWWPGEKPVPPPLEDLAPKRLSKPPVPTKKPPRPTKKKKPPGPPLPPKPPM